MRPVFIYALLDPITSAVRYAGQTVGPDRRLRTHIRQANEKQFHSACWVKSLLNRGLQPVMEILDVVPDTEADFWEREYIQNFRERGFDLTNATPGGDGNIAPTEESKERNRQAHLGKRHAQAAKEKVGIANRGIKKPCNKTGVVGVCFDVSRRKWKASLMVSRQEIRLGRFKNFEDAVFVRHLAEAIHFS